MYAPQKPAIHELTLAAVEPENSQDLLTALVEKYRSRYELDQRGIYVQKGEVKDATWYLLGVRSGTGFNKSVLFIEHSPNTCQFDTHPSLDTTKPIYEVRGHVVDDLVTNDISQALRYAQMHIPWYLSYAPEKKEYGSDLEEVVFDIARQYAPCLQINVSKHENGGYAIGFRERSEDATTHEIFVEQTKTSIGYSVSTFEGEKKVQDQEGLEREILMHFDSFNPDNLAKRAA